MSPLFSVLLACYLLTATATFKSESLFNMHVRKATNHSIDELNLITLLRKNSHNENEKIALNDCMIFYNMAIERLQQILDPGVEADSFDAQIWLSAAATSLRSCKNSVEELNVRSSNLSFLSNGASSQLLLTQSLDINGRAMKEENKGFHSWIFSGDRIRLLKESGGAHKLVVAQDGSGNFRTIKEALQSIKGNRKGRISIHIKQGTYNEYLEVSSNTKNVEFVGDGIGKTIITGNKGFAQGGSTMMSSTISKILKSWRATKDFSGP